jgi:hypothetical protein
MAKVRRALGAFFSWTGFWLLWVAMSVAGRVVDWALFRLTLAPGLISLLERTIGSSGSQLPMFEMLTGTILGVVDGLILGLYQWVALRKKIEKSGTWVLVTSLFFALSLFIFYTVSAFLIGDRSALGSPLDWGFQIGVLDAIIGGLVLGIGQWLVLRKQVERSIWWIPGMLVATLAAWFVRWYLTVGISFLIPGAISGIVLIILLNAKPSESPDEPEVSNPGEVHFSVPGGGE